MDIFKPSYFTCLGETSGNIKLSNQNLSPALLGERWTKADWLLTFSCSADCLPCCSTGCNQSMKTFEKLNKPLKNLCGFLEEQSFERCTVSCLCKYSVSYIIAFFSHGSRDGNVSLWGGSPLWSWLNYLNSYWMINMTFYYRYLKCPEVIFLWLWWSPDFSFTPTCQR